MSRDIPLSAIHHDPEQPRKHFDHVTLRELAQSMQATGLATPILLRPDGDQFVIIAGERRFRAAQLLSWPAIAADVRDIDVESARWLALVENVQRADLTPSEEARAFRGHMREGLTQGAIAARIGKTQSYVAQKLRLLKLPDPLILFLDRGALSEGHARQLLRLEGMYHDLKVTLNSEGQDYDHPDVAGLEEHAKLIAYLIQLRPEEQPVWAPVPKDVDLRALIADGCRAFDRWLKRERDTVPTWGVKAFWWSCVTIDLGLSVTDLHTAIDLWHERFLAAVTWYLIDYHGIKEAPTGGATSARALEWWGYYADLKHATHLPPESIGHLPDELIEDAIGELNVKDYRVLPTSMQTYGTHVEMGRRVTAGEA